MKKYSTLVKIFVAVVFVGVLVVNYLATSLPIGGLSTGELSDLYPNLFTPAGVTFSIWGLIYTLLGLYVVYQFVVKEKEVSNILMKVNGWLLINFLANIGWIFAWHYRIVWLSLIIMLTLLFTLIKIAEIINAKDVIKKISWWIRWPFSIYFGWITVATIANATVLLVDIGWDGFGIAPEIWTVIVLLVGALIGVWRSLKDRNIPYILVFVWGYAGILLKHLSGNGFGGLYQSVIVALVVLEAVFLLISLYLLLGVNMNLRALKKLNE